LEGKNRKVSLIPVFLPRLIQGHVQVGVPLDLHGHQHQVHVGGIKEPDGRLILRRGVRLEVPLGEVVLRVEFPQVEVPPVYLLLDA